MQNPKVEREMIENYNNAKEMQPPSSEGGAPLMRSKADDLTVWQSIRRHKIVGLIAMTAAFCASLDGYRMAFSS